jgi:hypothetical protein
MQMVYEVYKQNGWPYAHFDIENCRAELTARQDEWDRVQKAESEARSKRNRENFLKRIKEVRGGGEIGRTAELIKLTDHL